LPLETYVIRSLTLTLRRPPRPDVDDCRSALLPTSERFSELGIVKTTTTAAGKEVDAVPQSIQIPRRALQTAAADTDQRRWRLKDQRYRRLHRRGRTAEERVESDHDAGGSVFE